VRCWARPCVRLGLGATARLGAGRNVELRRVGRHRADHRVAAGRELPVHAELSRPAEQYVGTITKVGLDLGVTGGGQLVWQVLTSTTRRRGVLAGSYAGASAEASAIVGVGANLLVGGNERSVALQPLSVQGQVGINIAAGVAEIALQFVR